MDSARTINVEFLGGPLDGWWMERTTDETCSFPEAFVTATGTYVIELRRSIGKYAYRWQEGGHRR